MRRSYKILLFYSLLMLAAFDLHALIQRFFLASPEPIAWEKAIVAALLQVIAAGVAALYLRWISISDISLLEHNPSLLSRGLKTTPLLACVLLAALSVTVLYNAVNCGSHSFPANRGMTSCPL